MVHLPGPSKPQTRFCSSYVVHSRLVVENNTKKYQNHWYARRRDGDRACRSHFSHSLPLCLPRRIFIAQFFCTILTTQCVLHPTSSPVFLSPFFSQYSITPLHTIHQRNVTFTLLTIAPPLCTEQARLPLRTRAPKRAYRMLCGVLPQGATLFCSDIPEQPETQVGRWHGMRRRGMKMRV